MYATKHFNQRIRQRGITNRMIDITLEFGEQKRDKIRLGTRLIKKLLKTHKLPFLTPHPPKNIFFHKVFQATIQ